MAFWIKPIRLGLENPDQTGPPEKKDKKRHRILWFLLFLLLFLLIGGGAGYYYIFEYTDDLLDGHDQPVNLAKPSQSNLKRTSYVRDNNNQIIGRFFEEIRDPLLFEEIPEILKNGLVAAEDKKYYKGIFWGYVEHPGIDPAAIFRATIGNVANYLAPAQASKYLNYSGLSGASGILQQYVRLIYESDVPEFRTREKSIQRKIKEAKIAIQLAKRYPRDRVLTDFMNIIYLGHGVNGIAEATQRYFNKDIRKDKLTLQEVAILVSLNKSPYLYCPIFHKPDESKFDKKEYDKALAKEIVRTTRARERYNWVLGRMLEDGYISEKAYNDAHFDKDEPFEFEHLKVKPFSDPDFSYGNRLVKEFMMNRGFSDTELSYYGGFQIYTTLDANIQKIATEEFERHLSFINGNKAPKERLNGAFMIIEVKTGNILAISGGYDFNESQYNRVLASRSPGSGFKPFVIATALESWGKDMFSQVSNRPFSMPGSTPGQRWSPKNFEETNPVPYGDIDLATVLIRSVNLGALNLARSGGSEGMDTIIRTANSMGVWGNPGVIRDSQGMIWFKRPRYSIKGGLVPLLPTAIGASDVNLLELANAYAVFFRGGVYMKPILIREVKDTNGNEIMKVEPSYQERVLSEDTSNKVVAMMRAVTKIGTAKISMRDIEQQVACKTGTSDGPRDVSMWCGTPELFIAVRLGRDDYQVIELPEYMQKVSGRSDMLVSGGWVVGPLVRKIVDRIYAEKSKADFPLEVENNLQVLLEHYSN